MNKTIAKKVIIKVASLAIFVTLLACNSYKQEELLPFTLVWSDEFELDGQPDSSKWNIHHTNGCPNMCGFGNNEAQFYTNRSENVYQKNGLLVIRALKETFDSNQYTSAKLTTKNKGDWKTGRIVVRAKIPSGIGTWPAIWMLPTLVRPMKWPNDGEIDIMEHVGYQQGWILGTIHTQKYNHTINTQKSDSLFVADASDSFHDYILEWENKELKWYVDDQLYASIPRNDEDRGGWPFDDPYHLIINLAVGGNWGGKHGIDVTIWPQALEIDYVRVFQRQ